eukprot:954875-Prorocentrum_minimum.AAC.2
MDVNSPSPDVNSPPLDTRDHPQWIHMGLQWIHMPSREWSPDHLEVVRPVPDEGPLARHALERVVPRPLGGLCLPRDHRLHHLQSALLQQTPHAAQRVQLGRVRGSHVHLLRQFLQATRGKCFRESNGWRVVGSQPQ